VNFCLPCLRDEAIDREKDKQLNGEHVVREITVTLANGLEASGEKQMGEYADHNASRHDDCDGRGLAKAT